MLGQTFGKGSSLFVTCSRLALSAFILLNDCTGLNDPQGLHFMYSSIYFENFIHEFCIHIIFLTLCPLRLFLCTPTPSKIHDFLVVVIYTQTHTHTAESIYCSLHAFVSMADLHNRSKSKQQLTLSHPTLMDTSPIQPLHLKFEEH